MFNDRRKGFIFKKHFRPEFPTCAYPKERTWNTTSALKYIHVNVSEQQRRDFFLSVHVNVNSILLMPKFAFHSTDLSTYPVMTTATFLPQFIIEKKRF